MNEVTLYQTNNLKLNQFTPSNIISILKETIYVILLIIGLISKVKSDSILNLNTCSDRINFIYYIMLNILSVYVFKLIVRVVLILFSLNSQAVEGIFTIISYMLKLLTCTVLFLLNDDLYQLKSDCLIYFCFQVKFIILIKYLIILDIIATASYFLFIVLLYKVIINFFTANTTLVYKFLGVSPYLFNCFEKNLFDKKLIENLKVDSITCVVCFFEIKESEEIIILKCHPKHLFHSNCILQWLKMNFNCPICKKTELV